MQKTEGVLRVPSRVMTQGKQVIFGISLMAPIAIFGTYGVANELSKGLLPAAYLLAFLVMLITCQSFLGFNAVTTIAEESVEPERTILRTLIFVTVLNGIVFILIAYLGVLAYQGRSFISSDTAAVELVEYLGGPLFETLFLLVTAASVFTLIVSQRAGISRLLFVMGRDRVFPEKLFCYTHPRYATPVGGIIFIGVLTVAACMIFDLVTLASLINLGAFVASAFVNLCVILHYFVKRRLRTPKAILLYLLLPAIGIMSNVWLLTSLSPQAFLAGGI